MLSLTGVDWFPEEPDVPAAQRAVGESSLRYDDVSQDGRVMLTSMAHSMGDVLWRKLLVHHPAAHAAHHGIVPILTRFVIEGGAGPVSVRRPLDASGRYQFAHTVDASGAVDRLLLNLWSSLTGPAGRTSGPPPANAGEPLFVGRVFAEHVLTRPFASPAERKVRRLEMAGMEPVPPARWSWRPLEAVLALPEGAAALDAAPLLDEAEVVFGLQHTDSNQHVNSLVYPKLFGEAALRRFAAHGRPAKVLPRRLEIAYRKPSFAGDRARIRLQTFSLGDELGAVGSFVSDGAPATRPHCAIQIRFGA